MRKEIRIWKYTATVEEDANFIKIKIKELPGCEGIYIKEYRNSINDLARVLISERLREDMRNEDARRKRAKFRLIKGGKEEHAEKEKTRRK